MYLLIVGHTFFHSCQVHALDVEKGLGGQG